MFLCFELFFRFSNKILQQKSTQILTSLGDCVSVCIRVWYSILCCIVSLSLSLLVPPLYFCPMVFFIIIIEKIPHETFHKKHKRQNISWFLLEQQKMLLLLLKRESSLLCFLPSKLTETIKIKQKCFLFLLLNFQPYLFHLWFPDTSG